MTNLKLLFIEDKDSDIQAFVNSLERFNEENGVEFTYENIKSKEEYEELKSLYDYDVVISDIKLQDRQSSETTKDVVGNDILKDIQLKPFNIPVIVITATSESISCEDGCYLEVFTKGDGPVYFNALEKILSLHNIGIIQTLGLKGEITKSIKEIYNTHIKPQLKSGVWDSHYENSFDTKSILLRYFINIMHSKLKLVCNAVSEEMYIIPNVTPYITMGSIIEKDSEYFVVLNPECDLELRLSGQPNSDFILLCKVKVIPSDFNNDKKRALKEYKLSHSYYLRDNSLFNDSYLNFRDIKSISYEDCNADYNIVGQITNLFSKEIIQKFSSYYSRQGQPEFYG